MKKQSKKTKKLLLDFIDAVIDGKVQLKSADIKIDNLHSEEYDMGAIAMLKLISEGEGWEESEKHYYNLFFKGENVINESYTEENKTDTIL